ncbi:hypothetical protein [Dyadobacter arcticus]|uniref:Uncharacterized protein n=1 Tax=Dyadobacter arcticus TaxID=1078754 RepID=A0ABX0UHU2_9BACT|nr:hypothetical protein [Dyadobacter arcticus]NIJ52482.1 hypothetical protein [Dyadobacter arcticus]
MTNEESLVIKLIDSLAAKHEGMLFLYGYDEFLNHHIVEVGPLEKFKNDEYLSDEVEVIAQFLAIYPDKGFSFIGNDPYIKVENPIYQTKSRPNKSNSKRLTSPAKSFWNHWARLFH